MASLNMVSRYRLQCCRCVLVLTLKLVSLLLSSTEMCGGGKHSPFNRTLI